MTGKADACRYCGKPLEAKRRPNRVYCSEECRKADLKRKWHAQNPKSPMAAFAAGTIAEANALRVSTDLLERGYGVFRAAFPSMPYDIIMVPVFGKTGGPWRRVKVTSGSRTPKGTIVHPRIKSDVDIVAVVMPEGITYEPALPAATEMGAT